MRLNIAIFFGALFGALGVLLFLVAFGSDYWLLVTEVGKCSGEQNIENVTFHHEGFFWRCWFNGIAEENQPDLWKFWYGNQPASKTCTHAYLSPYPFMRGEHNATAYDSAVGILFSLVVILYVIWVQAVADMESYTNMRMKDCLDFTPSVLYGWSFFLAPAGVFFSLLSGLLFLVVGRHIQLHH
ncbi:transmembrane protein 182 isoform X2 [Myotis lucifugus]|uniref:transmembrane protein 182 isoform X2 n=1 Tax=Myotis lucifugus TaxID=59463 RepID=UPI000CCBF9A9|nr:transmembrane protein 182 isoform X2 [Myotis lucifugus]